MIQILNNLYLKKFLIH